MVDWHSECNGAACAGPTRAARPAIPPRQRPLAKNANGLIGEFFPMGMDFSRVSEEEVRRTFGLINDRPRKVLGYRTANEVYQEGLLQPA